MPLLALILIALVSLVIVRAGAIALKMTGLSSEVSDFQAISCFFGVGFTTLEAEMIVSHPARRRIATHLIIVGNIGLTGALSALIVMFVDDKPDVLDGLLVDPEHPLSSVTKVGLMILLVLFMVLAFKLGIIKRILETTLRSTLERSGAVRAMDYDTVLHARDGYVVSRFEVDPGNPMVGRSLGEIGLGNQGCLVIGILRGDGEYVGAPRRETHVQTSDVLTVYGVEDRLREVLKSESQVK